MSETKMVINEHSPVLPADVKIKVTACIQQLLHDTGEKVVRACRVYKATFDSRVKHTRAF